MSDLLNGIFQSDNQYVISSFMWIISLFLLCILSIVMGFYVNRLAKEKSTRLFHQLFHFLIQVSAKPLISLFILYCADFAINISLHYFVPLRNYISQQTILASVNVFECLIFFWLIFNVIKNGQSFLLDWANRTNNTTISIILPAISSSIYILFFLACLNIILPVLDLAAAPEFILKKGVKAFLIMMFGWVFVQILNAVEKLITNQYVLHNDNVTSARKIHTQLLLLKRVLFSLMLIIVVASILMLFDSVKALGTGLLTTAGIISAIGAFASQQSLSRMFAGLLIAFTQPIRIGDTIIIDKELGQVEEITLSYVVVKLWDLRRLILPTDQLMNKGLLNLTRESSELLGTVFIYADYTLPVEEVRKKFFALLNASPLWDKKVASFNVTEIKENCMEIRGLMSAANSSKLWELRCQIREKIMNFIVENFPECLAKTRTITNVEKHNEDMAAAGQYLSTEANLKSR